MKIISKHNKKDFYDYLSFGYDTSDDIIYLRNSEDLNLEESNLILSFVNKYIPHINAPRYNPYISYLIVGIYPYCYVIPYLEYNSFDSYEQPRIIFPYSLIKNLDKLNDHIKKCGGNVILDKPVYIYSHFFYNDKNEQEKFKCEEVFKELMSPTFVWVYNDKAYKHNFRFNNYNHKYYGIKNPIFNDFEINVLKYIKEDLDKRPIYNDIENFLWSIKQEPISEPDNKTKIINHGFDLKTSFRKM